MTYNEQVRMFKKSIPVGVKKTCELIEILKTLANIEEIEMSDLGEPLMLSVMFNAKHCISNELLKLNYPDMSFFAFSLINDHKNSKYFNDKYQVDKSIYVVFEEHTGFIWSGNNTLFLDLELAKGVSRQEYETEGSSFRSILSHMAIAYCDEQQRS